MKEARKGWGLAEWKCDLARGTSMCVGLSNFRRNLATLKPDEKFGVWAFEWWHRLGKILFIKRGDIYFSPFIVYLDPLTLVGGYATGIWCVAGPRDSKIWSWVDPKGTCMSENEVGAGFQGHIHTHSELRNINLLNVTPSLRFQNPRGQRESLEEIVSKSTLLCGDRTQENA
jgi:hypothetical protein